MASEVLLSNIIPFAGSGLVGYAMGFALKKILKWVLIIIGFRFFFCDILREKEGESSFETDGLTPALVYFGTCSQ